MDHAGAETIAHQFLRQPFRATLRAGEDQSLSFFCIEQLAEDADLFSRTHFVRLEFDALGGLQHRPQCDSHRIAHVFIHQACDGLLHRG